MIDEHLVAVVSGRTLDVPGLVLDVSANDVVAPRGAIVPNSSSDEAQLRITCGSFCQWQAA